ncbi:unnamed protein product [Tuber aestivum]|uniref:Fungal N-terminal domain-containing protein n=1 Tax=Tuber aestivum TaxID=59557 RepID=A0A292Q0Z5_9PEZI|nr:unnamed protein product [Tuber aestivum]
MDVALIIGILGTADICLRAGQNVCQLYSTIPGARRDINDLIVRVENVWVHIAHHLRTIQHSSDAVPDALRGHMVDLLRQLEFCLHTTYRNLKRVTDIRGWTFMKKIKFALFLKRLLQRDVTALEKWRVAFASTFFTPSTS